MSKPKKAGKLKGNAVVDTLAKRNIEEYSLKSDSEVEDDVYDEDATNVESESEVSEEDQNDINEENHDEIEDEDKLDDTEIDGDVDEEDKKETSDVEVDDGETIEEDTDLETESTTAISGEDGCMYNFVSKKKIPSKDDEDDDDYYDDELFDDETTLSNHVVKPEDRITQPILFKYERVRLLSCRTKQLSLGAKSMIKNTQDMDPKAIARLELEHKVLPIIIERTLPNFSREHWKISELEINN